MNHVSFLLITLVCQHKVRASSDGGINDERDDGLDLPPLVMAETVSKVSANVTQTLADGTIAVLQSRKKMLRTTTPPKQESSFCNLQPIFLTHLENARGNCPSVLKDTETCSIPCQKHTGVESRAILTCINGVLDIPDCSFGRTCRTVDMIKKNFNGQFGTCEEEILLGEHCSTQCPGTHRSVRLSCRADGLTYPKWCAGDNSGVDGINNGPIGENSDTSTNMLLVIMLPILIIVCPFILFALYHCFLVRRRKREKKRRQKITQVMLDKEVASSMDDCHVISMSRNFDMDYDASSSRVTDSAAGDYSTELYSQRFVPASVIHNLFTDHSVATEDSKRKTMLQFGPLGSGPLGSAFGIDDDDDQDHDHDEPLGKCTLHDPLPKITVYSENGVSRPLLVPAGHTTAVAPTRKENAGYVGSSVEDARISSFSTPPHAQEAVLLRASTTATTTTASKCRESDHSHALLEAMKDGNKGKMVEEEQQIVARALLKDGRMILDEFTPRSSLFSALGPRAEARDHSHLLLSQEGDKDACKVDKGDKGEGSTNASATEFFAGGRGGGNVHHSFVSSLSSEPSRRSTRSHVLPPAHHQEEGPGGEDDDSNFVLSRGVPEARREVEVVAGDEGEKEEEDRLVKETPRSSLLVKHRFSSSSSSTSQAEAQSPPPLSSPPQPAVKKVMEDAEGGKEENEINGGRRAQGRHSEATVAPTNAHEGESKEDNVTHAPRTSSYMMEHQFKKLERLRNKRKGRYSSTSVEV